MDAVFTFMYIWQKIKQRFLYIFSIYYLNTVITEIADWLRGLKVTLTSASSQSWQRTDIYSGNIAVAATICVLLRQFMCAILWGAGAGRMGS